MTRLGLGLGITHAILAAIIFGATIVDPFRADLLPIVMFCADFPFSLLFDFVSKHLVSQNSRVLLEAILYTVFGSVWFLVIGEFISRLLWPEP